MKVVSPAQMKEMDERTMRECGVPGEMLMERAGGAVADAVCELVDLGRISRPSVFVAAGKGNNAGDAFVAARVLAARGIRVDVWLAAEAGSVGGDARTHMDRMLAAGVRMREMHRERDWSCTTAPDAGWNVVVDGLLGTGLRGGVHGTMAGAIAMINRLSERCLVVAIDVPSGLDADTGVVSGDAVLADLTVTMGFAKRGMLTPAGKEHTGSLMVADIGIPSAFADSISGGVELIVFEEVRQLFKRRRRDAHKGSFGHVLVVGGSAGYSGAAAMAAQGALRSGAGLVSVITPRSVAAQVAANAQEAMVHPAKETEAGTLSSDFMVASGRGRSLEGFDAVLVGPGMGTHDECRKVVVDLLRRCRVPLVLDADALNVQKKSDNLIPAANCPVVMTPHAGELARFMADETRSVEANKVEAALGAAAVTSAIVVLKGAGTVVAGNGRTPHVNMTGNPGMATGGTGDVLAGIIVGLLGQGFAPFEAARAAVYIHGRAGDVAAWRLSQAGMLAGDVIREIPFVMRGLCGR
ncbi:MAG: NAD(P)H-hydrate dehydratase [bacterium]